MGVKPIWLAAPTRFAKLRRNRARWVAAVIVLLLLASLTTLITPGPPAVSHDPASAAADRADVLLYRSIVEGVRGGGNYYSVAAEAQRQGGYPVRPFVTMRLPTLAVVQATLPDLVTLGLLYAIAIGLIVAWYRRLTGVFVRPLPRIVALLLLGCGGMVFLRPDLAAFHEVWAGLLIALSLALWRPDRWIETVAVATCAMLIRETAALYAVVMLGCALASGRRREALGWIAALSVLAAVVAVHYYAWSGVVRASDGTGPGWTGLLGFGFFAKTIILLTALAALPEFLAAMLVALALFGWAGWRDPTATRVVAVLSAYALLIALFCRTDTYYWGLLVAPVSLVGLAFVPDSVRDLYASAIDKRRITVTRRGT